MPLASVGPKALAGFCTAPVTGPPKSVSNITTELVESIAIYGVLVSILMLQAVKGI
jgi:F0F1-type ATP synthase membrane subunit c/vacuolar-type H+-ATPase subunit K